MLLASVKTHVQKFFSAIYSRIFVICRPNVPWCVYVYCFTGLYEVMVKNCEEPPTSRALRRVDSIFVTSLKERILNDTSGIGIPLYLSCVRTFWVKMSFRRGWRMCTSTKYMGMYTALTLSQQMSQFCDSRLRIINAAVTTSWQIIDDLLFVS